MALESKLVLSIRLITRLWFMVAMRVFKNYSCYTLPRGIYFSIFSRMHDADILDGSLRSVVYRTSILCDSRTSIVPAMATFRLTP